MNWIDLVWPMMSAASMTLAFIHLLAWFKNRDQLANLMFAITAVSISALAIFELLGMRAQTPEDYALILRWGHVPALPMVIGIVGFVYLQFRAGRLWLGTAACLVRAASLVANFLTGDNLNFLKVTGMHSVKVWGGDTIVTPFGDPNPWMVLGQLSHWLLLAFLIDAIVTVWRRGAAGERLRVLVVCGSMAMFLVFSGLLVFAVVVRGVHAPISISLGFLFVVFAMSHDLGGEILRSAQLAKSLLLTQASLHDSEQRMDLAVRAAAVGLWNWDAAQRKVWLSEQGLQMLGFAPDEDFDGDRFLQQVHPEDRDNVQDALARALSGQGEAWSEFRLLAPEGKTRWIVARGRVEFDEARKPLRIGGVVVDATERKRMEHESAMQRDELAHLSRVALLAELSGSLAHELNQPLTAILSNAQAATRFLAHSPPNVEEVRESLVNIVESDKRAGEVIRRLRAMLRKDPPEFQRLDLNEVVQDVLRIIRSDLLNRSVETRLELAEDLPLVHGDRVQLQQVLLNLIMNGSDAMAELNGGRILTLRTSTPTSENVEVSIGDVGRGIPEADLERIFTPFVTSKSDGMGLGLAVCTTIVEAHRGRLWASNNAGAGATLHLELPVA